jgi:hypothetical protein
MSHRAFLLPILLAAAPLPAGDPQDGLTLRVAVGTIPVDVSLSWTAGAAGPYTVYRSTAGAPESSPANLVGTTSSSTWTDTPPAGSIYFYRVTAQPVWKRDVTGAPVDPQSSAIISNLAAAGGFGNGRFQIDFSITVLTADATAPFRSFTPTGDFYSPDCDSAPVPVPVGGALEGESGYSCLGDGDCHLPFCTSHSSALRDVSERRLPRRLPPLGSRPNLPAVRKESSARAPMRGVSDRAARVHRDELAARGSITRSRSSCPTPGCNGVYVHPRPRGRALRRDAAVWGAIPPAGQLPRCLASGRGPGDREGAKRYGMILSTAATSR